MARLLAPLALLLFALALPLTAGDKELKQEPEKVPAHILLHQELLKEQEALQQAHTRWLLLTLKLKQRLSKSDTPMARQEAIACAKLLDNARPLPELYDSAVVRLKQSSLASLPHAKDCVKATGTLADELQRVRTVMKTAPPWAYLPAEIGPGLIAAMDGLASTAESLPGPLPNAGSAFTKQAIVTHKAAYQHTLELSRRHLQTLIDAKASSAAQAFCEERLVRPLAEALRENGGFHQAEATVDALTAQAANKAVDPSLVRKLQAELRACAGPLDEAGASVLIMYRLDALTERQRQLHARLRQHHDAMLGKLLQGVEKGPD